MDIKSFSGWRPGSASGAGPTDLAVRAPIRPSFVATTRKWSCRIPCPPRSPGFLMCLRSNKGSKS